MKKPIHLDPLFGMVEQLREDRLNRVAWTTERRDRFLEVFAVVLDYVQPAVPESGKDGGA